MFEPATAPQTLGELLIQGIALGRVAFRRLFMFTTLLAFIGIVPTAWLVWHAGDVAITPDFMFHALWGNYGILRLAAVAAALFLQALIILRIHGIASMSSATTHTEYASAARSWWRLVLATLVYFLSVMFGLILLLVPGMILAISLMFYTFAVVLEDRGPVEALNFSHNIVWGSWWRTVGMLLLVFIPLGIAAAVLASPFSVDLAETQAAFDTGRDLFKREVVEMVLLALTGPFIYSILYLYYRDLKLRRAMRT